MSRDCITGYIKNPAGTGCVQCVNASTYRDASTNVLVEGSSNVCYTCSGCQDSKINTPGNYMTRQCAYNQDRGCTTCTTWCGAGSYRTALCNTTHNRQCTACVTRCPAGMHLSPGVTCSGSTENDAVLAACRPCLTTASCTPGTAYLSGTCSGTETSSNVCLDCDKTKSCPGQYRGGCANFSNTRCLDYAVCGTGYYLADESVDRNGACKPCSTCEGLGVVKSCTKYDDAVCGGNSCNGRVPCPTRTNTNRSAYFCDYSRGEQRASCGVCPPGYSSDGQFCLECQRGFTCDRIGGVACRGQCGAGVRSECESKYGLGYAVCDTKCELPAPDTRLPWRGSYVQAQSELCATYFLCTVGYYKVFGTGGSIECQACNASLLPTRGVLDMWVTEGLSVGDDSSCLWECNLQLAVAGNGSRTCAVKRGREGGVAGQGNAGGSWLNAQGQLGGVCGVGQTSQAGTALGPGDCLACQPLVGDVMRWKDRTDQCEFECVHIDAVKMGSVCVQARRVCGLEGLVSSGVGASLSCTPQSFPWNVAGYAKSASTGWGVVTESLLANSGQTTVQYPLLASVGYGIKGRHTITMDGVSTPRTVEGRLCSATQAVRVGNWSFVFGSLCNQSFLVYLNLSASSTAGLGVLIGSATRGWRDGFRTQALFESELYVAARADSAGTVFVLDKWNCLLREVVVWDRPGSYLTRVYTLWGDTDKLMLAVPQPKCYGDGSLAWPRRFWWLDGDWLAFTDEDGLWQFDTRTRELLAIVKETDGVFEADALASVGLSEYYFKQVKMYDRTVLVLTFNDKRVWLVRAAQELCPEGWTSLKGGGCDVECRLKDSGGRSAHFVSQTTGECLPCTVPTCGRGEELVPCSAWRDAYCQRCEFAANPVCSGCPWASLCLQCEAMTLNVTGAGVVFSDVADWSVVQFKASGTISFSLDTRVDILVVGGGGNGAQGPGAAGGGAGTVIFARDVLMRGGVTLAVTVGGAGQASSIGTDFIASGGAVGGMYYGYVGGTGGGIGGTSTVFGVSGIYTSANAYANAGAPGGIQSWFYGGSGGGAGGPATGGKCGAPGPGLSWVNISGKVSVFSDEFGQAFTSVAVNGAVAGGGGGGVCCFTGDCPSNGLGGIGASWPNYGGNGAANTGSGGGGGYDTGPGTGAAGLVLIRASIRRTTADTTQYCTCKTRSSMIYVTENTCDAKTLRTLPPCEIGWYATGTSVGGASHCERCPAYTTTFFTGATMLDQCKCVSGMVRKTGGGGCVGEALYEYGEGSVCADEGTCRVPLNAMRLPGDGIACRWYCNAGFYRDTRAGFLSQCRRCLVGSGRTRGDDDSPWSCE